MSLPLAEGPWGLFGVPPGRCQGEAVAHAALCTFAPNGRRSWGTRQRRPGCGILLDFAISLFCDFLLLVCFLAVTCCGFCSASVELLCFAESG